MKRTTLLAALLTAGSIFASPVSAQEAVGFRLNWYLSGWMAPFYHGAQEGFYKAEGIDVTLHEGRGSGVTIQLIGAKTDMFGFADSSTTMVAITKDVPVKSVASILNINDAGVISLAGKGIKSAKDLETIKIATTPGDSTTATFPALLAVNKLDRSKVQLIQLDPTAKPLAVMEGRADALLGGVSDQPFVMQSKGFKTEHTTFAQLGVSLLGFTLLAHNDTIKEKPDLVRRFVRATSKSWEYARANPEKVMPSLKKVKADFDTDIGL
ncbi:MAG: ABC transporter substrate-binding protein [Alphaproteobacteria bacterium]|nr:ABC transporter substrate-binding protein [Alphaproteobacteria bacterium]